MQTLIAGQARASSLVHSEKQSSQARNLRNFTNLYIPVKLMEPEILMSEAKSKESCNYFYTGQTIATF